LRRRREESATIAWQRRVKVVGLAACVLLLALVVAGSWAWRRATKVRTLAIVPVTNLSGKAGNDYLSVGLTRSLFDKLSALPKLKVRLPSVVPTNAKDPAIQAGRDLAVEAVLTGDVVEQDGNLILRVRLLNTADGKSMWERAFDLRSIDMLAVQDTVGTSVTSAMGMWLTGNDKRLLARHQTDSQEALTAYMRGRHYWSLKGEIKTALKFFDQAIELDPAFAEAYAGRADCYVLSSTVLNGLMPTSEAMEKASYNARKALEINPMLPEPHTSLGTVHLRYDWNWIEAEKEFKLAIDLNPDYGPAHYYYSLLLAVLGRFDESISESAKAKSLDPDSSTSALNYTRVFYLARRNDEAEKMVRKLLQDWPESMSVKHTAAWVFMQQGKFDEAIPLLQEEYAHDALRAAASLGYAYGRVGKYKEAEDLLQFLENYPQPTPAHERAIVYIGMRDWQHGFEILKKDCEERFSQVIFLGIDPLYDPLRADPRFAELMRCANLTQ
jgi:tetratricopeptide (TPR) repeat protein